MSASLLTDRLSGVVKAAIEDRVGTDLDVQYQVWVESARLGCTNGGHGEVDEDGICWHRMPVLQVYVAVDCCEQHRTARSMTIALRDVHEADDDHLLVTLVGDLIDQQTIEQMAEHSGLGDLEHIDQGRIDEAGD